MANEDTLTYTVKWYLRNLPAEVDVSVGSYSLTDYAIFVMTPKVVPSILNNYSIAVHKIYPNPARNKLHIEFNEPLLNPAEINLFNLTGKQVLSSIISGNSTIDISNLPSGVYVYSINSGDVISRGKLIKEERPVNLM